MKHPDGRIEDWVHDLVVELVALDGVPTAHVPQVIERVRRSFTRERSGDEGGNQDSDDNQTISDCSVRRVELGKFDPPLQHAPYGRIV